jgi:hypothetical protein
MSKVGRSIPASRIFAKLVRSHAGSVALYNWRSNEEILRASDKRKFGQEILSCVNFYRDWIVSIVKIH